MSPAISNGVHISLRAEEVFRIGNFAVTNTLLLTVLAVLLLCAVAVSLRRRLALVPGRMQNVVELIMEGMLSVMDSVLVRREKSEKYLPLVATIFLFVITSNWLGLFPGLSAVGLREGDGIVPLFRSPASDLNFTLSLALLTVLIINILGSAAIGIKAHMSRYFDFSHPIKLFTGILELISEFAKIISFSFRLFGNVFAGEVLLIIVAFLVPFAIPLPFIFMEIFVGFIQAFIFAMLALVFVAVETSEHGEAAH